MARPDRCWFLDPKRRDAFEASAREKGIVTARAPTTGRRLLRRSAADSCAVPGLEYRVSIDVPGYGDSREATIRFVDPAESPTPVVLIDGPPCLRHRWLSGSLCMWLDSDPPEKRWVLEDGLLDLVGHIEAHAFCEAECRAGLPWPKPEGPGDHPRRKECPSCLGRGR